MKPTSTTLAAGVVAASISILSACSEDSAATTDRDATASATYKVTFGADWSATTFPVNFPSGAHFSALTGATHNEQVIFWQDGQPASNGIEVMAETGAQSALVSELQAAKADGKTQFVLAGPGAGAEAVVSFEFDINPEYPQVTLVSMVAPSPDWFVGVQNFTLFDSVANDWKPAVTVELAVYDAGSDNGALFTSANSNTQPAAGISRLSSNAADTDFIVGFGKNGEAIATFTFERVK